MTQAENSTDFKATLRAAILESLLSKNLLTAAEKKAIEQKNLSSK